MWSPLFFLGGVSFLHKQGRRVQDINRCELVVGDQFEPSKHDYFGAFFHIRLFSVSVWEPTGRLGLTGCVRVFANHLISLI